MHANIILSCTVLLFAASALGADSFRVIAPDPNGRQLLVVSVDVKESKVECRQENPLVLPLNPTSIVQHRGGTRLVVTTSQESEGGGYPAADVEVSGDGKLRCSAPRV